jgi:hypothetical protein
MSIFIVIPASLTPDPSPLSGEGRQLIPFSRLREKGMG